MENCWAGWAGDKKGSVGGASFGILTGARSIAPRESSSYTNFSLRLHYFEDAGKEGHAETISPEPA
jgi:hypothetical protein